MRISETVLSPSSIYIFFLNCFGPVARTRCTWAWNDHFLRVDFPWLSNAQPPDAPPFRRYATHDPYDEGIGLQSSAAGTPLRQQHSTSRLLLRGVPGGGERGGGHAGNAPRSVYDRDLPDRGWSQSAPPLGNAGGPHGGAGTGGAMTGRMGGNHGVIGGRGGGGGGIEYAAPVPRHHRQHEGGGHNPAAIGSLSASNNAALGKEGVSNGGSVSASGVGGGGGARWDRDPPRDTMAFASSKYPPGCFPAGGVYGEGAIFEQVRIAGLCITSSSFRAFIHYFGRWVDFSSGLGPEPGFEFRIYIFC